MSYEFKIAWRYFFSKSKQTVVNRINTFALIMVVVTTTSLFVVLSAFSGLKEFKESTLMCAFLSASEIEIPFVFEVRTNEK